MSEHSPPHRTEPPPPSEVRPFDFPAVAAGEMENGLALRAAPTGRFPLVALRLVLDAGEAAVEPDRAGLGVLTGESLETGTARRSGVELAEALEGLGAGLSVNVGWDAASVGITCLAGRLEEALDLVAEVVLEPTFPDGEVERIRGERLAAIRERRKNPGSLATDMASRFVFRDDIPYARPLAGTPESMADLDADDVRAYHEERFRPGRGGLLLVGDVDPEDVRELVGDRFDGWRGTPPNPVRFESAPREEGRSVHIVHRPGSVQSEIRIGHVGAARDTPDYFPLIVLNAILGGTFTSRLNLNLRERNGFTYGVRSRFKLRRRAGPFLVSTAVSSDVTAPAVREALSEVAGIVREGVTPEEVDAAKDYIRGVFPLRLETVESVASRLTELIVHGLPGDYYRRYRDRVAEVRPEEVEAAARRHIRPDELAVVVVGDAGEVREPLESLEVGPVEVHQAP